MAVVISKEKLEELYRKNPNKVVARRLGVSITTLLKYLVEGGIELKGSGNSTGNRRKFQVVK